MSAAAAIGRVLAIVLGLAVAVPACAPAPHGGATCPLNPAPLRAAAHRKEIGTAYRSQAAAQDPCYSVLAARNFDSLTPEIATFMNAIEPVPGRYDFADADAICAFARRHRMRCQLHNVVWDPIDSPQWHIVPDWVLHLSAPVRRLVLVDYVSHVVSHFAGRVETVTVVNEAFDARGALRPSTWNTTGDDSYIFDAFRAARRADPRAELLYNDYGAEDVNSKSDAVLALATRLRAERVVAVIGGRKRSLPLIDGVGFQMHVGTGPGEAPDAASVRANIARFANVGLRVRFTEMDVRVPTSNGAVAAADLAAQRTTYTRLVQTCVRARNCDGITFWGFTDKFSWVSENQQLFPGEGAADLLDTQYAPKPAYGAVRAAISTRR